MFSDSHHSKLYRGKFLNNVHKCVDSEIHTKVKNDYSYLRDKKQTWLDEGLNRAPTLENQAREKHNKSSFLKSNARFPTLVTTQNDHLNG